MPEEKVQITIEAIDKAKAALTDLANNLKGISDRARTTGKEMAGLGGVLSDLKKNWAMLTIGINQALEIFNKIKAAFLIKVEWGEMGAAVMRTEQAFKSIAETAGYSADEVVRSLQRASRGAMHASDIMQRAGRLMQEGITPQKLEQLMTLLQKQAPAVGDTIQEAWERIGTALTTGNMIVAKQYVGFVDLDRELDNYAAKLGGTKEQLTEHGRIMMGVDLVIDKLTQRTKGLTSGHESYSESIQRSKADIKGAWEEIYKSFTPFADKFLKVVAAGMKAIAPSEENLRKWRGLRKEYQEQLYGFAMPEEAEQPEEALRQAPSPPATGPMVSAAKLLREVPHDITEQVTKALEAATQKANEWGEVVVAAQELAELGWGKEKDIIEQVREALERVTREANEVGEVTVARQELMETGWAKEKDIVEQVRDAIEQVTREANEWGEVALAAQELVESGWAKAKQDIEIMASAYKELFEKTGKYGQNWADLRKKMLEEEIINLRKTGMAEEDLMRLRELRIKQIEDEASRTYQTWVGVAENLSIALQSGFFDLFKQGLQDVGEVFRSFCTNLVNSFYRAISQMITNWMIFGSITGYTKGMVMGGLMGWISGLSATTPATVLVHSGGVPGQAGWRLVPRLHFGLREDEFPAILQTGEGVVSRKGMKALEQINEGKVGSGAPIINNFYIRTNDVQSFRQFLYANRDLIIGVYKEDYEENGITRRTKKWGW